MKWELKGGALRSESKIHRAKIVRDRQTNSPGYILDLQIGYHPTYDFKTSHEAEKWAEARMNEFKKEFISSLIVEIRDTEYGFGGLLEIFGGYEGVDKWTVYHGDTTVYEGTLEECKNYIAECF